MTQSDATDRRPTMFLAYPSRLQALVAIAAFLPLTVSGLLVLPFGEAVPLWGRIMGIVILAPVLVFLATRLKLLVTEAPTIEISDQGIV